MGRREVAYRLFAAEYDDADLEYSDSDEERAPNYVVTPTGARVNRLFVVGVLTEVNSVSEDVLRARVVDPTGAFVVYAGQYQPDALAFLEGAEVPAYVAVTGKARTFQPEGSDRVFTSVRPESITAVDEATRDRWTVQAAEHTLARVVTMAEALDGDERGDELVRALTSADVEPGLAAGVALAIDHYETTPAYLSAVREQAVAALEVVAGERDAVPPLELAPNEDGPVAADLLTAPPIAGTLSVGDLARPAEPAEASPPGSGEPGSPAAAGTGRDEEPGDKTVAEAATDEPEPDGTTTPPSSEAESEALGDFESSDLDDPRDEVGEYDLDEAEREQVEEEFGTEFSTGTEVGEPGAAGIDQTAEPPATEGSEAAAESSSEETSATPTGEGAGAEDEPAEADIDLEDVVVETMADLDEGDGAERSTVIETVVEAHGVDPEAVDEAIQEALMSGRCYEPSDGRLKAI